MQEAFLHFIWQHQYFDKKDLCTAESQPIEIFDQGFLQSDAGPDFFQCRIKISEILWSGNVEIHVNSSAWLQHHHDEDKGYDNVVLHVVWENDVNIYRTDGTLIPVLELKERIDVDLIDRYKRLIDQPSRILCKSQYAGIDQLTKLSMWDKALMNRLERKAQEVKVLYEKLDKNWEEATYRLLFRSFGFKVNADAFLLLAKSIPLKYIHKHANNLLQVEALLFGQAGFLEDDKGDDYYLQLRNEHLFLTKKYQLHKLKMNEHQWKFLRLRPANFPTVRLAQLAILLVNLKNVFSTILNTTSFDELFKLFSQSTSEYWNTHYHFEKKSELKIKRIGKPSVENLIINTVPSTLVAYGKMHQEQQYIDRAVSFLQVLKPEINSITRQWKLLSQPIKSAFDSQAGIELFNEFCLHKRCLSCNIGVRVLTGVKEK